MRARNTEQSLRGITSRLRSVHSARFLTAGLLGAVLVGMPTRTVQAQAIGGVRRVPLARRLVKLESTRAGIKDKTRRQAAVATVDVAVKSFFSFRLARACRKLDEATLILEGRDPAKCPNRLLARSLDPRLDVTLLDSAKPTAGIRLVPAWQPSAKDGPSIAPAIARAWAVRLALRSATGQGAAKAMLDISTTVGALLDGKKLSWDPSKADRDLILTVTLSAGDETLAESRVRLAVVRDRDRRLALLTAAVEGLQDGAAASTVRAGLSLLGELAEGRPQESEPHGARLLSELEAMVKAGELGPRSGDRRLWLPIDGRVVALRMFQPKPATEATAEAAVKPRPRPLVIALHGAGGSEHMFMDACGAGMIKDLCAARGWLLVSPALGFMGGVSLKSLVAAVEALPGVSVDPEAILVVGHSMGAGHAAAQLSRHPRLAAAAAFLGGGGSLVLPADYKDLPIFVAAGSADFGRPGAEAMVRSLRSAGARTLSYEVLTEAEHLLVVQDALPLVFRLFDRALARTGQSPPPPGPVPKSGAPRRFF